MLMTAMGMEAETVRPAFECQVNSGCAEDYTKYATDQDCFEGKFFHVCFW